MTRQRPRAATTQAAKIDAPYPLDFFSKLVWLDKRPLMDTIEPYRRRHLENVLYTFGEDGWPQYNRALMGRAKKNNKTTDLMLAGMYRFFVWPSPAGNDCYVVANDEGQAADDLDLFKKLLKVNPILDSEVDVRAKEIVRKDGAGRFRVLPAQDAIGAHGKTFLYLGLDEIHGYRDYSLIEALSPDPTRRDVLTWITSYAPLRFAEGVPLYDLLQQGKTGDDPAYYFSWYGGDYTNDPDFAGDDVTPEQRANPSMASWGNDSYLRQQEKRLPRHRFRRLHLNLPGAPDGAAFDAGNVLDAIVSGRRSMDIPAGVWPVAAVDMSGGKGDDATLAIAYRAPGQVVGQHRQRIVLAHLSSQNGRPPFNPRHAVAKFARILREYHISTVCGDNYAGETFKSDFAEHGITYVPAEHPKSFYYEELDPKLNAGEVELLDLPQLQEQLLGLVWRGTRIDHQSGGNDHDDFANSAAIAIWLAGRGAGVVIDAEILRQVMSAPRGSRPGWAGGIPGLDMPYGERHAAQMERARALMSRRY